MSATLTDRLVVALDPTPETRAIVSRAIVGFAEELSDDALLGDVVTAAENPRSVTSSELAARAGVSYRQINYWTSEGHLVPDQPTEGRGSGTPLTYPPAAILKARLMGSLVRLFTMKPARAAELADEIVRDGKVRVGGFTLTRDGRSYR